MPSIQYREEGICDGKMVSEIYYPLKLFRFMFETSFFIFQFFKFLINPFWMNIKNFKTICVYSV